MFVVFVTSSRCNARCTHCFSSCGPRRTEALPETAVRKLMDEAAKLADGGRLEFSITGGEPFLEFDELTNLVAHAHALGAWISVVSNGYWASTPERAERALSTLQAAGLNALAVSASRFHTPYVPADRPRRALETARDLGLHTSLKYVASGSDTHADRALCDWAETAGLDLVQRIPLLPTLREGAELPASEFPRADHGMPAGCCPAPVITVRESGEAYPCCTPGAHTPWFSLGNVHRDDLTTIRNQFRHDRRQRLLRQRGPAHVAEAARAAGHGQRLRQHYAGICDLCTHITNDPVLAEVADACAREHQLTQLRQVLAPLVKQQEASAACANSPTPTGACS